LAENCDGLGNWFPDLPQMFRYEHQSAAPAREGADYGGSGQYMPKRIALSRGQRHRASHIKINNKYLLTNDKSGVKTSLEAVVQEAG
jgi:hypothetical protein